MSADRVRWLLLAIAGVVLVAHSLVYNFVTDDAYISFVFSRNLAEHGQLTFNAGELAPVEGYTNFLWTVVLGLLMVIGIAPEWSSRVLGTACALATLYLVFRVVERALGRRTPWAAVAPMLLACSAGFACWTSGGLETQLFTLLVMLALDAFVAGALRRMAIALALAAMTRPEGLLVAAVLGAALLLRNALDRRVVPNRGELISAGWFLLLWAPWFAWRWWYYGWPFPNTYYVKAHGPWASPQLAHEMWSNGAYYVWAWLRQTRLVWALPLVAIGLGAARPRTPRFALTSAAALLSVVYLAYTVTVGGDFMGLHRFIMPVFALAAIAVVLGLEWVVGAVVPERWRWVVALVVCTLVVGVFAGTQIGLTRDSVRAGNWTPDHGIDTPAFLMIYTEDRAAIGAAMAPCFRDDDFSIVGGAGAQPYLGRMRAIDVFGLVSEKIAHDEPRIRARAGHTKFGNDNLLATYNPTFVFSCYEIDAKPDPQPRLPCAGFWLAKGYEEVTMRIPGMQQLGEYYTFLALKTRAFSCPGRVH